MHSYIVSLFLLEMEVVPAKLRTYPSISFHARVPIKVDDFFFFFFNLIRYFLLINCSFLLSVPARMEEERDATNAQILWSACTALARAIKSGPPGAPIEKIVRPLESEIKAVCKAARKCIQFKFNLLDNDYLVFYIKYLLSFK